MGSRYVGRGGLIDSCGGGGVVDESLDSVLISSALSAWVLSCLPWGRSLSEAEVGKTDLSPLV
jgi:hypothetical protein